MNFVQQLINGLQVGAIYALVALGYTMVYGIVQLINFAHGDIIMVGAYISLTAIPFMTTALGLPVWACVAPAVVGCSVLGMLTEKIAYRPLRHSPRISALITAIGISLFLQNAFMLIYSASPRPFKKVFVSEAIKFLGLSVDYSTAVTILITVFIMVALQLFVNKTKIGKAMRAVSEDEGAAKLVGINVNHTIQMTFAIGSGLAAAASILYLSSYPQLEPSMGSMLGLKAFVAAVLGGIGILPGAMIGGVIMGVIESMTKAYISSELADAVVFGVLIVVLLIKPSGLLGKNVREKV